MGDVRVLGRRGGALVWRRRRDNASRDLRSALGMGRMIYPLAPILDFYDVYFHDRQGWQKILCPVHDEDRPSCSINLETDYLTCHACGFAGHTIDLVMARESCTYATAAIFCSRIAGCGSDDLPDAPGGWRSSGRVSDGSGYRPRMGHGALQARLRRG